MQPKALNKIRAEICFPWVSRMCDIEYIVVIRYPMRRLAPFHDDDDVTTATLQDAGTYCTVICWETQIPCDVLIG